MITNIDVRKAVNGFTVSVERVIPAEKEDGTDYNRYVSEIFVFEKLPKLQKALKLFASDLGMQDDSYNPPF